jgi:hypothetical protein
MSSVHHSDMEKGEIFIQSLANYHFPPVDHWGYVVQLISYEAKDENVES